MNVGIIGTGTMGKPMAHHIRRAGHALFVYARSVEKVKDLEEAGARIAASPAEVGAKSECIVLSLPFDPEVDEVVLGEKAVREDALINAAAQTALKRNTSVPDKRIEKVLAEIREGSGKG